MMKKILVPFDGSETALRALEFAAGIGKPFGSEIMVVNVIVPYDYTKVPPRKPKNAIEEAEMAAKEPDPTPLDIAKGILDKLGCTTASYRLIVDIDPAERILEYAKTAEADMIVLGNSAITPDYYGFVVPNEFVVGYGLDYAGTYRNLPFVGVLKDEVHAD